MLRRYTKYSKFFQDPVKKVGKGRQKCLVSVRNKRKMEAHRRWIKNMVSMPCASLALTWRHRGREQKAHRTNEITSLILDHNSESLITEYIRKGRRRFKYSPLFKNFSNFVSPLYTYYSNHECHCLPPLGTGKTSILQVLLRELHGRPRLLSQNIRKLRFRTSKLRIKLVSFARFWICVSQPKVSLQKHRNCEQWTCEKQPFACSSPEQHARHSPGSGGASALRD